MNAAQQRLAAALALSLAWHLGLACAWPPSLTMAVSLPPQPLQLHLAVPVAGEEAGTARRQWLALPPAARPAVARVPSTTSPAPEVPATTLPLAVPAAGGAPPLPVEHVPLPVAGDVAALPHYFVRAEVERMPQISEDIAEAALAERLLAVPEAGRLQLELWISALGAVDRVELLDSDLPALANREIAAAFARARFTPAWRAGQAVASRLKIEVELRPAGS